MGTNIALGSLMMIVTTAIHGIAMMVAIRFLATRTIELGERPALKRLWVVGGVVLLMFGAGVLESAAWAATFVLVGAISGAEPALYFSTVTFTTLGYGEIVLDPEWRLLASFEAANGIIMMGWTTAIVVAAVQRVADPKAMRMLEILEEDHV